MWSAMKNNVQREAKQIKPRSMVVRMSSFILLTVWKEWATFQKACLQYVKIHTSSHFPTDLFPNWAEEEPREKYGFSLF